MNAVDELRGEGGQVDLVDVHFLLLDQIEQQVERTLEDLESLESVLFSAQEPLSVKDLREVLKNASEYGPEAGDFKKTSFEEVVTAL